MRAAWVGAMAAGALALGGCGSGTPDGDGTTPDGATPTAEGGSGDTPTEASPSGGEGAGGGDAAGEYVDPAADMPRFDGPTDFMEAPGLDGFWSTDSGCNPVEKGADRDPMTGDRVPYKEVTCWAAGTEEEVTVVVYEGGEDVTIRAAASVCPPEEYAVTCFPGNGWVVHTLEVDTHVLPEVMEAIDVEVPEVEVPADSY